MAVDNPRLSEAHPHPDFEQVRPQFSLCVDAVAEGVPTVELQVVRSLQAVAELQGRRVVEPVADTGAEMIAERGVGR